VNDSCVLMGVVDEKGILEEDEVFIQIERSSFENQERNRILRRMQE